MSAELRSPDVYIEERMPFPPTVAQVETALPAFIGYTEKAIHKGSSLLRKAFMIQSLTEFEACYGKNAITGYRVWLDPSNAVTGVDIRKPYFLYDSLRLYFQNGGGRCLIVSVGKFKPNGSVNCEELIGGLNLLEKEDDPTIIVCPDAVLCSGDGLYEFQRAALAQCERRGDRMMLCDLHPGREINNNAELSSDVQLFRENIGNDFLRFGAAYVPYLQTSFTHRIRFRDIELKRKDVLPEKAKPVSWLSMPVSNAVQAQFIDLKNIIHLNDLMDGRVKSTIPWLYTLRMPEKKFRILTQKLKNSPEHTQRYQTVRDIYHYITEVTAAIAGMINSWGATASASLISLFQAWKDEMSNIGLKDLVVKMFHHSFAFSAGDPEKLLLDANIDDASSAAYHVIQLVQASEDEIKRIDRSVSDVYIGQTDQMIRTGIAEQYILSAGAMICELVRRLKTISSAFEETSDLKLEAECWLYKQIRQNIALSISLVPPSGAIAGIYARVDRNRGVWKAPANERIHSVIQPAVQISADEQSRYNVDMAAGKSINCIRSFSGAGVVVWGARTLAGNDNEWRYVNVRRFFNMVNESCRKSIAALVFEPNDPKTWVKVKSMIENFLIGLWRQGALQGSKPEHAFYVKAGIGTTMTEQDVYDGRMIVELGMAMIRPAEFIIIRITQHMNVN